jgi:hypothetical protein
MAAKAGNEEKILFTLWISLALSFLLLAFEFIFSSIFSPVLPVKGVMESSYSVPNTPGVLPRTNRPRLIVQGRSCAHMYSIQLFFRRHSINFKRQYDAHCFSGTGTMHFQPSPSPVNGGLRNTPFNVAFKVTPASAFDKSYVCCRLFATLCR